jgi:hypothetical protein
MKSDTIREPYPQHISQMGRTSVGAFLISAAAAYTLEYYTMMAWLIGVYVMSQWHWSNIRPGSWIQLVDMFFAIGATAHITFVDAPNRFVPPYQYLWYVTATGVVTIFVINETVFFYAKRWTVPGTIGRELVYYTNTWVHMLGVHILPATVSTYCAVKSSM